MLYDITSDFRDSGRDGEFESGGIMPGEEFSVTFKKDGYYYYYCDTPPLLDEGSNTSKHSKVRRNAKSHMYHLSFTSLKVIFAKNLDYYFGEKFLIIV